ncbi:MAG: Arc family DNA-binding protein [Arsenophonus endosymbiont of Dermacentor nuttalli]
MREAIADIAKRNSRSMNTEIIMILQESINRN